MSKLSKRQLLKFHWYTLLETAMCFTGLATPTDEDRWLIRVGQLSFIAFVIVIKVLGK